MNRFAQLQYGKVIYIFETELKKEQLPQIFSPATYWVDVTGQDVEVGDIASFDEKIGIVFTHPKAPETFEDKQKQKIAEFKALRDRDEEAVIMYKENGFDYDRKARERLAVARRALEDNPEMTHILWTTADNTRVDMKKEDFQAINTLAAQRSNELHIKYNECKAKALAATTEKELDAVIW